MDVLVNEYSRVESSVFCAVGHHFINTRDEELNHSMLYQGSCHCQKINFTVEAPESLEVENCNCSICSKSGFLHLIVPLSKFTLISGKEFLSTYTFNTGIAQHNFCKVCGVKPFYRPRSNPDGIDVNVNCLDTQPIAMDIIDFDGKNWEQHAAKLAHKSKE